MMEEVPQQLCTICGQAPEDMLILSCSHNLCLPCATELHSVSSDSSHLQCQICLAFTPLDQQTIECLSQLASPPTVQASATFARPSVAPPMPRAPKNKKGIECFQHNQEALYYCFDCQNGSICSQCILEPSHAGHSILTLKKASKILAQKLKEKSQELQNRRLTMQHKNNKLQEHKQTLVRDYQEKQANLKTLFENILQQTSIRYNELSRQLQDLARRSTEMVDGAIQSLNTKLQSIDTIITQNKNILKQPEEQLIVKRYVDLTAEENLELEDQINLDYLNQYPSLIEGSCLSEMQSLLQNVVWSIERPEESYEKGSQKLKENQMREHNSMQFDISVLGPSPPNKIKNLRQPQYEEDANNSVSQYSGIKSSSRRLELSRSMNNATNIISRLQERSRR